MDKLSSDSIIEQWVGLACEYKSSAEAWQASYFAEKRKANILQSAIKCAIFIDQNGAGTNGIQWLKDWIDNKPDAVAQFKRYLKIFQ